MQCDEANVFPGANTRRVPLKRIERRGSLRWDGSAGLRGRRLAPAGPGGGRAGLRRGDRSGLRRLRGSRGGEQLGMSGRVSPSVHVIGSGVVGAIVDFYYTL